MAVVENATPNSAGASRRKIAVVVVHGVADQKPGATALSLVDLLVSSPFPAARYASGDSEDFVIPVVPMPAFLGTPTLSQAADPDAEAASLQVGGDLGESTPLTDERPVTKALLQSMRSDFQRDGPQAMPTLKGMARQAVWTMTAHRASAAPDDRASTGHDAARRAQPWASIDRGLQFTQYLLRKANRNGAATESYASRRIGLQRNENGVARGVDVFEMYWADLSRLSGAIPRILTEIFTLVFRLSRLGRDTVDEASRSFKTGPGGRKKTWTALSWMQAVFDWLFVYGLALLFAQLLLLGVAAMAVGAARAWPSTGHVVGLAIAILALGSLLYFSLAPATGRLRAGTGLVIAGGIAMALVPEALSPWALGLVVLVILSIGYHVGLSAAADRFPFSHSAGMILWAAITAVVVAEALLPIEGLPGADANTHVLQGLVRGIEWTLGLIKAWWFVVILFVVPPWSIATIVATFTKDFEARASAATGRLGLLASMMAFLLLAMAAWAALEVPLTLSVAGASYDPLFWHDTRCLTASAFLDQRFLASTETFALIALLLALPMTFTVAMFVPSILAELRLLAFERGKPGDPADDRAKDETLRLGRWLTGGFRWLDTVVFVAACVSLAASVLAFFSLFGLQSLLSGFAWFAAGEAWIARQSTVLLAPLAIGAGGLVAAFSALGGLLSKYLPGLRGPLDVALDVDNFLREFPRHSIPRARIFARYRALLSFIAATEAYERVVIVSHSQGTVISAELLRFLSSSTDALPHPDTRAETLATLVGSEVRILTLGCPLRQLYAARFPTLYRWILDREGAPIGPRAKDIGVSLWANAFTSGDYVGRWLWSGKPAKGLCYPTTDSVYEDALGRSIAYDRFVPDPPTLPELSGHEFETCIGFGAHTHYFDRGQLLVAALVDHLVAHDDAAPAAIAATAEAAATAEQAIRAAAQAPPT